MNTSNTYVIKTKTARTFDDIFAAVPAALQAEGFGVLTQIDLQGTLRNKLGIEFRRYHIFGACHPQSAHKVLQSDLDIGVLLPCNVVIYEGDDGHTVVAAIDPMAAIAGLTEDLQVHEVAREMHTRLEQAVLRVTEPS